METQKAIINQVSIKRKEGHPETYYLPTFLDIIKNGSITTDLLDMSNLEIELGKVFELKYDHTNDFNTLSSLIPDLKIDANKDLVYKIYQKDYTFLNKDNIPNYIDSCISTNTTIQGISTKANKNETDINDLQSALNNLPSTFVDPNHSHKLLDLEYVNLDGNYITFKTSEQLEDPYYIEYLNNKLISLNAFTTTGGTVYITPKARIGQKALLVAEPSDNYEFDRWTLNNGLTISHNPIHIIEVDSTLNNALYLGIFKLKPGASSTNYTLLILTDGNGVVKVTAGDLEYSNQVSLPAGQRVYLLAIGNSNNGYYKFSSWGTELPEGASTEDNTNFVMTKDITLHVTFDRVFPYYTYVLPIESSDNRLSEHTHINNEQKFVKVGDDLVLEVPSLDLEPDTLNNLCGYEFQHWYSSADQDDKHLNRKWTLPANLLNKYFNKDAYTFFYAYYKKTYEVILNLAKDSEDNVITGNFVKVGNNLNPVDLATIRITDSNPVKLEALAEIQVNGISYEFAGWSDDATIGRERVVRENADVYPIYVRLCKILVVASPLNGGTVNGSGNYRKGITVTLKATPAEGYNFILWSTGDTTNEINITVSGDATYTATFAALAVYTITANSNNAEYGTVAHGSPYNNNTPYSANATCSLLATAKTNYLFENWYEDDTVINVLEPKNSYTFTVTKSRTIEGRFIPKKYRVTVTTLPSNNAGDAFISSPVSLTGTYDYGSTIYLTVSPKAGYVFDKWTGGTVTNGSMVVKQDTNLVAHFKVAQFNIKASANNSTFGYVEYSGSQMPTTGVNVNYNGSIELKAVPNDGYVFVKWLENNTIVYTEATFSVDHITEAHNYVAVFELAAEPEQPSILYITSSTKEDTQINNKEPYTVSNDTFTIDSGSNVKVLTILIPKDLSPAPTSITTDDPQNLLLILEHSEVTYREVNYDLYQWAVSRGVIYGTFNISYGT